MNLKRTFLNTKLTHVSHSSMHLWINFNMGQSATFHLSPLTDQEQPTPKDYDIILDLRTSAVAEAMEERNP